MSVEALGLFGNKMSFMAHAERHFFTGRETFAMFDYVPRE